MARASAVVLPGGPCPRAGPDPGRASRAPAPARPRAWEVRCTSDRGRHRFRLDVLLAAQHFDLLVEQIRHVSFLKSSLLHSVTYLRASRFPRSILCALQFPLRPAAFSSCPICLSFEGSEVE